MSHGGDPEELAQLIKKDGSEIMNFDDQSVLENIMEATDKKLFELKEFREKRKYSTTVAKQLRCYDKKNCAPKTIESYQKNCEVPYFFFFKFKLNP